MLKSYLTEIGADPAGLDNGRCEARWRGAMIRGHANDSERLQAIQHAVSALQDLPDPLSVAEVNLRRATGQNRAQQFVPSVTHAQATHLQTLSGDSAFPFVDRDTGTLKILSTDVYGEQISIEHVLPKASVAGTPARSAAAVVPCDSETSLDSRWAKLRRLLPVLSCVRCSGAGLEVVDATLRCVQCAETYEVRDGVPILLRNADDMVPVGQGTDVSSNSYSRQLLAFAQRFTNGWVLDCGCGQPVENVPNIVHLEVAPYKNVDIVALSEELPFAPGAFAAAASESVLEHVKNPWQATAELHRVLAKDGVIRVDAPFLAPFHAYPNHFHNFTQSGLDQLLSKFEKLDGGIGPHQEPWLAIGWILRLARDGLADQPLQSEFDATTLGSLLTAIGTGVPPRVVHPLNDEARLAIAAGFFFYGKKR